MYATSYHLYIIDDKPPIKGEYFYVNNPEIEGGNTIQLCTGISSYKGNIQSALCKETSTIGYYKDFVKKVLATTDLELNIPGIKTSFIEKYIEENNKKNIIQSVNVEYEDNGYEVDMEGLGGMDYGDTCWMSKIELKLDKDGCIITHKIKDFWNREEVISLLTNHTINLRNKKNDLEFTKIWIEKNL